MCYCAGTRQRVKKIFTAFKTTSSTILKPTYLHEDSEDYEVCRSEQIKLENFPILSLFVFFTEKMCRKLPSYVNMNYYFSWTKGLVMVYKWFNLNLIYSQAHNCTVLLLG